jgi:DNA-binding winged helix-turn-helix (wHTH) protein
MLCFGAFEIDLADYELRHACAPVGIQPRIFDLLVYLYENHDRVVTRAELMASVWNATVVSDGAIT